KASACWRNTGCPRRASWRTRRSSARGSGRWTPDAPSGVSRQDGQHPRHMLVEGFHIVAQELFGAGDADVSVIVDQVWLELDVGLDRVHLRGLEEAQDRAQ